MNDRDVIPGIPSDEVVQVMKKEAGGCSSCLLWHKFCKAECCKQVFFNIGKGFKFRIGQVLNIDFQQEITKDMKWYFELHGFKVIGEVVYIRLGKFKYDKKTGIICVFRTCDLLGDDLKCKGHPTDKPLICQELSLNTAMSKKFMLTPNCMFKYQLEDKK